MYALPCYFQVDKSFLLCFLSSCLLIICVKREYHPGGIL